MCSQFAQTKNIQTFWKIWAMTVWQDIGSNIDDLDIGTQFGYSVSLSSDGSVLAIGAPNNYGNKFLAGHVQIFLRC